MKKVFLKKTAAVFLTAAMLASLAGCGSQPAATQGTGNDGQSQASGSEAQGSDVQSTEMQSSAGSTEEGMDAVQELNLVLVDLKTLDVNDVRNANEFQVLSQVQEGLFRTFTDENGNATVENAGCESYEVSDDNLVYTFHLREMQWSDGVPVTAQQYVDSIKRLLNPDNAFAYSFMAYDIKNASAYYDGEATADDIGVKAIDDSTLEITLEAPIPFFIKKLTNVCFFPVRLDVIEAAGESYKNDYTKHVFNGPFVIDSRILDNQMVLAKNDKYWDAENVHLTKVTMTVVPEAATQSLLLESREIDAVEARNEYVTKWKSMVDSGQLVNRSVTKPNSNYMIFNQHTGGLSGLMNNEKVRLALSLAINREELNELVYSGLYTPSYGLIPYNMMVGDEEFRSISEEPLKAVMAQYDTPEKLVELLKEGLKEEGKSTDDLKKTEITLLSYASDTLNETFLEYMKQTWESKLGITVNVNICPDSATFITERNENKYDSINMGWNGDYDDPMTFMELFNTSSGYAKYMGGYSNEEFDKMFDSLSTIGDSKERAQIYIDMENNLIGENAGIAPLYYQNVQYFVQSYVKNLSTPNFGCAYEFSRAYISGKE